MSVDARDCFLDRIAASSAVGFIAKIDLSAQAIEKVLGAAPARLVASPTMRVASRGSRLSNDLRLTRGFSPPDQGAD
jgi:hypothetical protein